MNEDSKETKTGVGTTVTDWQTFILPNGDPSVDYAHEYRSYFRRVGCCLEVDVSQYTNARQTILPSSFTAHYLPSGYTPTYKTISSEIISDDVFCNERKLWRRDIKVSIYIIGWKNQKAILDPTNKTDPVNRPAHYNTGKIEVIDFIEDQKLGFCLGNCIKYIARAGKKDPTKFREDLLKAKWYLNRELNGGDK